MAERLLARFGVDLDAAVMDTLESDLYRQGVSFQIFGKPMIQMGIIASKWMKMFDLKNDVYYLEMDFGALMKGLRKHKITVQELAKYPDVRRDLALLLDRSVTFAQLRKVAFGAERKLLKRVSLFDVYEGNKLPEGKKSYALSFILSDPEKTLVDQVIDKAMNTLIREFERQLGAQVRS